MPKPFDISPNVANFIFDIKNETVNIEFEECGIEDKKINEDDVKKTVRLNFAKDNFDSLVASLIKFDSNIMTKTPEELRDEQSNCEQ